MKIIDCFTFYNELDLLKIRLELLYAHVDGFCISEANITHSGMAKSFNIELHAHELDAWSDKIYYMKYEPDVSQLSFNIKGTSFNPNSASWQVERGQRDQMALYARHFGPDDVFIVSDLDEIPDPSVIDSIRARKLEFDAARLEMQMMYYYMNCIGVGAANSKWYQGYAAKVRYLVGEVSLSNYRVQQQLPVIQNAGWHFSYLGGAASVAGKLKSFAHTELNTPEINRLSYLRQCIELGIDYLGRDGYEFAFVPVNRFPNELAILMRRNPSLLRSSLL